MSDLLIGDDSRRKIVPSRTPTHQLAKYGFVPGNPIVYRGTHAVAMLFVAVKH